jgi:hypothetical protein
VRRIDFEVDVLEVKSADLGQARSSVVVEADYCLVAEVDEGLAFASIEQLITTRFKMIGVSAARS